MATDGYFPFPDKGERIDPFDADGYEPQFIDATNDNITFAYPRGAGQGIDLDDYIRRVPRATPRCCGPRRSRWPGTAGWYAPGRSR